MSQLSYSCRMYLFQFGQACKLVLENKALKTFNNFHLRGAYLSSCKSERRYERP